MLNTEENWTYDLVYKGGGSDKFWRARVDKATLFINFGRTGTNGTTQIKVFPDTQAALVGLHERGVEKRAKGYTTKLVKCVTPVLATSYTPPQFTPQGTYNWPSYNAAPALPAYKSNELYKMPENFLDDLNKKVEEEIRRRRTATVESRTKKNDYVTAFQNFLFGCAHAMACRAALRWSAGHRPFGTTPADGKCWNALDGAVLSNLAASGCPPVTKDPKVASTEGWASKRIRTNPLLWKTTGDLKAWLTKGPYWATNSALWLH